MDDRNPVYVAWVRKGDARFAELGLALPLLPDEVFAYDAFVRREYRGRGVLHEVRPRVDGRLWEEGFRSRVAFTTPGRWPFGRNNRFQVGTVRVLRLGPLRKFWVSTCGPQAEYWRERLKEVRWV